MSGITPTVDTSVRNLEGLCEALLLLKDAIDRGNLNLAGLITADIRFDTEVWLSRVRSIEEHR